MILEYNEKLKSCPFCGGVSVLGRIEFPYNEVWYNPQCSECKVGWQENYETKEEAVEQWNKRKNK